MALLQHADAAPAVLGALVFMHGGGTAATSASRGQSEELLQGYCVGDGDRCGACTSNTANAVVTSQMMQKLWLPAALLKYMETFILKMYGILYLGKMIRDTP